jgi:hypothetical protein
VRWEKRAVTTGGTRGGGGQSWHVGWGITRWVNWRTGYC